MNYIQTPLQPPIHVGPTPTGFWAQAKSWFIGLEPAAKLAIVSFTSVVLIGGPVAAVFLATRQHPLTEPGQSTTKPQSGKTSGQTDTPTSDTPKTSDPTPAPATTPAQTPAAIKPASSGGTGTSGGTSGGSSGGSGGGGGGGTVLGCALPNYPNASCTGVPAGTSLTVVNGDLTVSTPGAVVDSKDVRGCIIVQAANVTIKNTKITCTSFYGIASYQPSDDGGLLVQDTEIDCDHNNGTGINYQGMTARRLHIHGCENGLHIDRDVVLTDSYIHDLYEGATGHGDGIQGSDGSNSTISHNTIYSESTTSSINLNNDASGPTTTNVLVSDNLLAGGAYALYCPIVPSVNYRIINNHFSTIFHPQVGTYGPSADCGDEIQSGNVIHETGAPLTLT